MVTDKIATLMIVSSLLLGLGCSSSSGPEPDPPETPQPGITWTAPGALNTIVVPPLALSVTADDDMAEAGIRFYLDGDLLANDTEPPYTATWNPQGGDSVGIHQVIATAFQSGGAEIISDTLYVMIADHGGPGVSYGGDLYDGTGDLLLTDGGLTYLCGSVTLPGPAGEEGILIGINSASGERWFRNYGPGAFRHMQPTDDGGLILTGWTWRDLDRDGPNQWLLRVDGDGEPIWSSVGGVAAAWEYPHSIAPCPGGWIITGRRGEGDSSRLMVKKIDTDGNEVWQHDDYSTLSSAGYGIVATDDGGLVVTGVKTITAGGGTSTEKGWLLKLNSAGVVQWESLFAIEGAAFSVGRAVLPTASGYMVAGQSGGYLSLTGYDSTGGQLWLETYGNGLARDLIRDGDNFVAVGYTRDDGASVRRLTLLAVDGAGNEQWRGGITADIPSEGVSIVATGAGFLVTGMIDHHDDGDGDILLLETGPQGDPLN